MLTRGHLLESCWNVAGHFNGIFHLQPPARAHEAWGFPTRVQRPTNWSRGATPCAAAAARPSTFRAVPWGSLVSGPMVLRIWSKMMQKMWPKRYSPTKENQLVQRSCSSKSLQLMKHASRHWKMALSPTSSASDRPVDPRRCRGVVEGRVRRTWPRPVSVRVPDRRAPAEPVASAGHGLCGVAFAAGDPPLEAREARGKLTWP